MQVCVNLSLCMGYVYKSMYMHVCILVCGCTHVRMHCNIHMWLYTYVMYVCARALIPLPLCVLLRVKVISDLIL